MNQHNHKLKVGDRVKVVRDSDPVANPIDPVYMGKIGMVTRSGDGTTVENMVSVKFPSGAHDAFWPEELELVED